MIIYNADLTNSRMEKKLKCENHRSTVSYLIHQYIHALCPEQHMAIIFNLTSTK